MTEPRTCVAPKDGGLCGVDISHKHPAAKTCSDACRSRLHVANRTAKMQHVDEQAKAAVGQAIQTAVAQYVDREVLTEDLLSKIKRMVELAPAAIDTLEAMLESEDPEVAIRSAQTILRYTMGNPSVAPAPTEQAPSPVQVVFGLPRPGDDVERPTIASDAIETRHCGDCGHTKPADEFVAGSSRCKTCFAEIQEGVHRRLAPADESS